MILSLIGIAPWNSVLPEKLIGPQLVQKFLAFNPSAWGLLKPSSYCDVGRFFYRVFKF